MATQATSAPPTQGAPTATDYSKNWSEIVTKYGFDAKQIEKWQAQDKKAAPSSTEATPAATSTQVPTPVSDTPIQQAQVAEGEVSLMTAPAQVAATPAQAPTPVVAAQQVPAQPVQ